MKFYILLVFAISASFLNAQVSRENYEPLEVKESLPDYLKVPASEKYKSDASTITKDDKRKIRKDKDRFYLESNFFLDNLMRSGYVLFDDEVTTYVNKVADEILKDDKQLRSELNFYVLKSSYPNAFATASGHILISLGLMSVLENEAQLAFILSHEITHYVEGHGLESYIEHKEIDREAKSYLGKGEIESVLKKSQYNIDTEHEADEGGFEIFKKSKWSYAAIEKVFDILEYNHTTWEKTFFDKTFFDYDGMVFSDKEGYFLDTVAAIKPLSELEEEGETSEYQTHPKTKDRTAFIVENIAGKSDKGRSESVVSDLDFWYTKETSRFETIRQLISQNNFQRALFLTMSLKELYPDNQFLDESIVKSLYGLAKYKAAGEFSSISINKEYIQGAFQNLVHFTNELSKEELVLLASSFAYRLHKEHPDNLELEKMTEDLFYTMISEEVVKKPSTYFKSYNEFQNELNNTDEDIVVPETIENDFLKYAFGNKYKDQEFKDFLSRGEELDKKYNRKLTDDEKKLVKKEVKRIRKTGYALGLDKVLLYNPNYVSIDATNSKKGVQRDYLKGEDKRNYFSEHIDKYSDKIGLELVNLDVYDSSLSSAEDFNDIVTIGNWMAETISRDEDFKTYIPSNYNDIIKLSEKYNTEQVAIMGGINMDVKDRGDVAIIIGTLIINPIGLPFAIARALQNESHSFYYSYVLDFESGNVLMNHVNYMPLPDKKGIVDTNTYYSLQQIKKKRK